MFHYRFTELNQFGIIAKRATVRNLTTSPPSVIESLRSLHVTFHDWLWREWLFYPEDIGLSLRIWTEDLMVNLFGVRGSVYETIFSIFNFCFLFNFDYYFYFSRTNLSRRCHLYVTSTSYFFSTTRAWHGLCSTSYFMGNIFSLGVIKLRCFFLLT